MMDGSHGIFFAASALVCATIASVHDLDERRIPNLLTGPSILIALLLHLALGGVSQMLFAALAGAVAGGLLLIFMIAGGMGAGDVKLIAAIGCFVGLPPLGLLLLTTTLCGAAFSVAIAIRHGRLRQTLANSCAIVHHHQQHGLATNHDLDGGLRMPFALPIAAGCLVTTAMQIWAA